MNAHAIKKAARATRFALGGLLSAMAAMGCVDQLPTSDKPCPCASGYVCCDSGRCASIQVGCDMSPAGAGGHAGTGAGGQAGTGSGRGGSGFGGTAGSMTPPLPSEVVAEVAGTWKGYLESFTFPSGSDTITINILAPAGGFATANVVFGDVAAPPPPTDPDVAWPDEDIVSHQTALEGWPYVAHNLSYESPRLRFTISRYSPWQDWCALQTPVPNPELGYACVPALAIRDTNGQLVHDAQGKCLLNTTPAMPVDCAKAAPLCMGTPPLCQCTMTECHAWEIPAVTFDIALRNGIGDGSTNLPNFTNGTTNIRLEKTTP